MSLNIFDPSHANNLAGHWKTRRGNIAVIPNWHPTIHGIVVGEMQIDGDEWQITYWRNEDARHAGGPGETGNSAYDLIERERPGKNEGAGF